MIFVLDVSLGCLIPFLSCTNFRYSEGEIRFNLMAIVSDRKMIYERKIDELQAQLTEVSDFMSDFFSGNDFFFFQ